MKVKNLSVKRLFGRVAIGLVLSMSGITIALFFVTKQTAVLLTGGALLLCALVGIFVLTQAFGKRLSQFTADLCQTLDHMIAGNEAPQRPEDSETQLARIGHRLARLYQIMQENRRRVDEERQEFGLLEAVGTTRQQLKAMLDREMGIYLGGSLVIALVFGSILSVIVCRRLDAVNHCITLVLPWLFLLALVVVLAVIYLIFTAYAKSELKKTSILSAIREE